MLNLPNSNEVCGIKTQRSLTAIVHSKDACIWCMKAEDSRHKHRKTYKLHLLNQVGINYC